MLTKHAVALQLPHELAGVATLPSLVTSLPVSSPDSGIHLLDPYPPIDVTAGLARLGVTEVAESLLETDVVPAGGSKPVAPVPESAPETETSQALDDVLSKAATTLASPEAKPKVSSSNRGDGAAMLLSSPGLPWRASKSGRSWCRLMSW